MEDLIYNQNTIPKDRWRYGLRSSAAVGCGWIATHNALRLMGYQTDIEALIRYYEGQLPLIHGNAGTSFWGPAVLFRKWGFPVSMYLDPEKFDRALQEADVGILFYRWRKGIRFGAHFVTVRYKDGRFTGYNTFRYSTGPDDYGTSLRDFLKKQKFYGAVLYPIRDKRGKEDL